MLTKEDKRRIREQEAYYGPKGTLSDAFSMVTKKPKKDQRKRKK